MKKDDIPYFVAWADLHYFKIRKHIRNLETIARQFTNYFYPPPPPDPSKIHVIYVNTSTRIESQIALFWGVTIANSNLDPENKEFLTKISQMSYSIGRIVPPFQVLPELNAIIEGDMEHYLKILNKDNTSDVDVMKALIYESSLRVKSIFLHLYGAYKKALL